MPTVIAYGTEKQAYFELFMESCHRFGIDPVILSVDPFDVIFLTYLEFNRTGEPTPETATGYNFLNAGTWISTAAYAFR